MVRIARIDDIQKIYDIDHQVLNTNWSLSDYEKSICDKDKVMYVYETDNQLVGFILLQLLGPEIEVLQLAVVQNFQRQGVASILLDNVFQEGVDSIFLEVKVSNTRALSFYKKNKFNILATRKNYYGPNQDAYVLRKVLSC